MSDDGDITMVLMDSGNAVQATETPAEVFAERSRALTARFPAGVGSEGSDVVSLTHPGCEEGSVMLDPTKIEGAVVRVLS